jgi:putative ABC transport system permease protein
MKFIHLTEIDLILASVFVVAMAVLSLFLQLGIFKQIIIAAARTVVQLLAVGLVLKFIFANIHFGWLLLISLIMLIAASREVMQRQVKRFSGFWGFGLGALSMFVSSFSLTLIALLFIIENKPWYEPQYAIPLLGMMLGNTMNGIALGLDRLTTNAWEQRTVIEGRLMMGHTWKEAIETIRRHSIRSGMIPIINSMAIAGLVSLPGMMTGQILAGSPPVEAVKYQILILFLISAGTGFGTMVAVWAACRYLFDERQRLRLDRLKSSR